MRSTTPEKWIGRKVARNGADSIGTVLKAWVLPEGVVGLSIRLENATLVTSTSEYYTVKRKKDK